MKPLKLLLFKRFQILSLLTVSMALSIVLLMIRIKIHQSYYLLFLVWNLFLAVIPYAVTTFLSGLPKLNRYIFALWFGVWLLFLPNAPYIVTDLLHLKNSVVRLMWLDVLVVTSFAYNGLILFFLSLRDMERLLKTYLTKQLVVTSMPLILILSAFGMYLGRFLRYNSWEIVQDPLALANDILGIIVRPQFEAWVFTFGFAAFLSIGYWMFKALINKNNAL